MLNMSSANVPSASDDQTARARIRDAAIVCFADAGVAATSVRTIATAAEVSPALVIHHFGSKDRLRVACDEHVAALVRRNKRDAIAAGTHGDPIESLRSAEDGPPLLRYLARTLGDGSPHVADLIDEMVDDAEGYLAEGVERGTIRPTDDPRGRAAVLTLWSLGALVLHEHVARLTGADLQDPLGAMPYARPALQILGEGVFTEELYEHYRAAFVATQEDRP